MQWIDTCARDRPERLWRTNWSDRKYEIGKESKFSKKYPQKWHWKGWFILNSH